MALVGLKTSVSSASVIIQQNEPIPSNWKTYINNKLGFTFQYPSTWSKYGEDANVSDRFGTTMVIEINFIDTASHTTFSIEYHLAPRGAEIYRYAVSQYESSQGLYAKDGKQIEVAGNKAIEAFTTITINGKGEAINPPLRLILVDFLDDKQTGEIRLQFKTPLPNDEIEVAKFKQLLSTFKLLAKD